MATSALLQLRCQAPISPLASPVHACSQASTSGLTISGRKDGRQAPRMQAPCRSRPLGLGYNHDVSLSGRNSRCERQQRRLSCRAAFGSRPLEHLQVPQSRPRLISVWKSEPRSAEPCDSSSQWEGRASRPGSAAGLSGQHPAGLWDGVVAGCKGIASGLKFTSNATLLLGLPALVAGVNLEGPASVAQALAVLAAIVTVHELGHFVAARSQNIHVTKFAIGFGPTLLSRAIGGVEYSLRLIPLGGFVAFPDDHSDTNFAADDPNLLKNRPIKDRAIVISAGVIANIISAFLVLFVQVQTVGLVNQTYRPGVLIPEVIASSTAITAGIQPGDIVLGVGGTPLPDDQSALRALVESIKQSPERELTLNLMRGPRVLSIEVVPERTGDGSGRIGVQLTPNSELTHTVEHNVIRAGFLASQELARLAGTVADGLRQVFFNFAQTADRVSGPVAMVAVGAEVARADSSGLFLFSAIVNLNLALVNILPLPALDGGYLALLALEAVRGGKKLPDGVEQGIMSSGFVLMLTLGVALMVKDTINLNKL